jgi:acyl-CoA thioester hydrolase
MTEGRDLELAGEVVDGVHRLNIRVYFEDTDFSGIVYHANYLRYCERGRSDFLRHAGVDHVELFSGKDGAEPLAFAVKRMEIEFVRPARIDDILTVESVVAKMRGASMRIDQRVLRGDDVLFEAEVTAVLINDEGKPRRFPEELRARMGGG